MMVWCGGCTAAVGVSVKYKARERSRIKRGTGGWTAKYAYLATAAAFDNAAAAAVEAAECNGFAL